MADASSNAPEDNGNEGYEPPRTNPSAPQFPMLLWIIIFVIVVLMVIWSIRRYGTRSSASSVFPASPEPAATSHAPHATTTT